MDKVKDMSREEFLKEKYRSFSAPKTQRRESDSVVESELGKIISNSQDTISSKWQPR